MTHNAPRRGRPALVTAEDILVAAVELIDTAGIDALTMRSLAATMNVAPMTLYRHVADKQALLALIPDALLVSVCRDVSRKRTGLSALRAVAEGLEGVLREHPGVAKLFEQPAQGPNMEAAAEHAVRLLVADGMSASDAQVALRAVVAQVVGEVITMHGEFDFGGVRLLLDGVQRRIGD